MNEAATDRQKRAVTFVLRAYKDLVQPMLDERGGSIARLTKKQATEILSAVDEFKKGGGEQQQEQKQQQDDNQDNQNNQDDQEQQQNMEGQQRKSGFRPGSKQEYVANALKANGLDPEATRRALADKIGKIPALTFTQNVNGTRVPLDMGSITDDSQQLTQFGRALKTIFAVRRSLIAGGMDGGSGGQQQKEKKEQKHEEKQEDRKSRYKREAIDYLAWCRQLRKFCQDRDADGHPIDEIGMRPVEYGAAMLEGGIPLQAIKHAITMHYPPEARQALGVRNYDVQAFHTEDRIDGVHAAAPYLDVLTDCRDYDGFRLPAALVGPKGTGKTTLARQLAQIKADKLGRAFPFGMVSMTSGTSPSAFNGRPRIADNGVMALVTALIAQAEFEPDTDEGNKRATRAMRKALAMAQKAVKEGDTVESVFVRCYRDGGVFLFDEMDAADENLLLGVNSALANGVFANPATGEIIERHPDFIPVAGMNTLGLGSGRDYRARNALDAATLDRWNAGRIQVTLDPRIEESMFWAIINRGGDKIEA